MVVLLAMFGVGWLSYKYYEWKERRKKNGK